MKKIILFIYMLISWHATSADWSHLFDYSKFQNVKISPDGKHLAVAIMKDNKRSLIFLNRKTKKYVGGLRLPQLNEVGRYYWVTNERVVIKVNQRVAWRQEPRFYGELYAVNIDGSRGEMIYGYRSVDETKARQQKHSRMKKKKRIQGWADIIDLLPDDDEHILISSTPWDAEGDRLAAVYKLNVFNGNIQKKKIAGAPAPYANFIADSEGNIKAATGKDKNNIKRLYFRKNNEWQEVSSNKFGTNFRPLTINEAGTHLFVLDNFGQDKTGFFKLSLLDGSYEEIFSDEKVDITGAQISTDGHKVYALKVDDGFPVYYIVNNKLDEAITFKNLVSAFPQQEVTITSQSDDGKYFVVFVSSDIDAGSFYLFDSEQNKLQLLFRYQPNAKISQYAYVDPIKFNASDGLPLSGFFTEAKIKTDKKIPPLVVLVHGGPHSRDYWGYSSQVQFLSLNGYSVLQVNYRGSTGYGQEFMDAGKKNWGTTVQQDILDAYHWAIENGKAEKGNACIMGSSFGGYSALQSVIKFPDSYQCAISNAGIYDLDMMFEKGDITKLAYGKTFLKQTVGTNQKKISKMSPVNHVDKITVPLFLAHGKQDERAPIEQVEKLRKALDAAKKDYSWFTVSDEGHGFFVPENQKKYMKQVVEFLDNNLSK
mgnify:FL=1